jgi:hypothetical protein
MDGSDCVVYGTVGLVDVVHSTIPHASGLGNVFCPSGIVVRLIQQFQSFAEAAVRTHANIDWRVIGEILAIIDRSSLDLGDRSIDFADRMFFILLNGRPSDLIQIGASQT